MRSRSTIAIAVGAALLAALAWRLAAPGGVNADPSAPSGRARVGQALPIGPDPVAELAASPAIPGGTIVHGTVSDVLGGPTAGARISMHRRDTGRGAAERVAITDDHGAYQLTVADGGYVVTASHDDYVRATKPLDVAGRELVVDFALVPAGAIRGRVVTHAGRPVAAARVVASGRAAAVSALSGDDGTFALAGLPPGAISLVATAHGYASAAPTVVALAVAQQTDDVELVVEGAFSIKGVIQSTDHQPIAGARVAALSVGDGAGLLALVPSDQDGHFEVPGARRGSYRVIVASDGFVAELGARVEVVDHDVEGVAIELGRGATLTGRVEPAGSATLELRPAQVGLGNADDLARAQTIHGEADANGAFTLRQVPAGSFVIVARAADGPTGELAVEVVGDRAGLVVALSRRASIEGRVVDARGNPADDVHVIARQPGDGPPPFPGATGPSATTGADGGFRITGLDAGHTELVVRDALGQLAWNRARPEPVELVGGEQRTGVTLVVESRDGVIRGRVVDGDGQGVADGWVTARLETLKGEASPTAYRSAPPALTARDGTFAITHLPHDRFELVADGPGGGARARRGGVEPDGSPVELVLVTLGTLTGHVTDGLAPVTAFDISCRGPVILHRQVSSDDGSFTFARVAPGAYACRVNGDSGSGASSVAVTSVPATVDITLSPWASIHGVVTGAVAPFQIIVGDQPPTVTDAGGAFTVKHVAPGAGTLVVLPMTSLRPIAVLPYQATPGEQVELGTIRAAAPRSR